VKSDKNWVSNAKLSWDSEDDKMGVALWVKNISDNDEPMYSINLQGGFGYNYNTVGLPRRMGVDFNYRF
jgi:hypothetical protein